MLAHHAACVRHSRRSGHSRPVRTLQSPAQVEDDVEIDEKKLKEALEKLNRAQQEAVETDERKRKYNSFAVSTLASFCVAS